MLGLIWTVPVALLPWTMLHQRASLGARRILCLYGLWFVFLFFMEWSTPPFVTEYDACPNYLFVEYLQHVHEVSGTILAQYPIRTLLMVLVLLSAGFAFWRWMKERGYPSTFFYGGESHFDNMRSFFLGNGFDRVVD